MMVNRMATYLVTNCRLVASHTSLPTDQLCAWGRREVHTADTLWVLDCDLARHTDDKRGWRAKAQDIYVWAPPK